MKNFAIILCLLSGLSAAGQVRISDFSQALSDGAASDFRTSLQDPAGELCAVLKLRTKESGWTFEAGLAGIMDTRYEDGVIWLYIPSYARNLTVAHEDGGVLLDWPFPVSLEAGRTYTMTLTREAPRAEPVRRTVRQKTPPPQAGGKDVWAPVPVKENNGSFSRSFADVYLGYGFEKGWTDSYEEQGYCHFGFSYTWIGNRVGPYISVGTDTDFPPPMSTDTSAGVQVTSSSQTQSAPAASLLSFLYCHRSVWGPASDISNTRFVHPISPPIQSGVRFILST